MASHTQPGGPAWLVTEFGATSSVPYLARVTSLMDAEEVGWVYWSWKYYGDPTGSKAESLVMSSGRLKATALRALSQTHPEAAGGIVPISLPDYLPEHGRFPPGLRRAEPPHPRASTVIFVPTDDPLPARLLRPAHKWARHVGAGERSARHPERPQRPPGRGDRRAGRLHDLRGRAAPGSRRSA